MCVGAEPGRLPAPDQSLKQSPWLVGAGATHVVCPVGPGLHEVPTLPSLESEPSPSAGFELSPGRRGQSDRLGATYSRLWDQTCESQVWWGHAPSRGPGEGPSRLSQLLEAAVPLGWWPRRCPGPRLLLCTATSLCCVHIS